MDENVNFDEYLEAKLIDANKFKNGDKKQYQVLKEVFDLSHPESFTAQKLFLINPIRRKFLLENIVLKAGLVENPKMKLRPKIKR